MRVLLASDGSAGAAEAAALAAAIPWPAGSVLHVVSVVEPIPMQVAGPWDRGAVPPLELEAAIMGFANTTTRETVEGLRREGLSVDGYVLRGRPASAILDYAGSFGADLVCVGSRGRGPITSLLLGSVSSEVVDQSPRPVLVARRGSLTRVVFGTDGSVAAGVAEAVIARWAIFANLPIDVVSVASVEMPWTTGIAPTIYREDLGSMDEQLRAASIEHQAIAADSAARLRSAARRAEAEMRVGDAAAQIVAAAEQRGADLIVVGSRGRTGLTRLLLGSVARNVLSATTASVLIVHGPTDKRDDHEEPSGHP